MPKNASGLIDQLAGKATAVSTPAARAGAERVQAEPPARRAEQATVEARGETLDLDQAVEAKTSARRSG